MQDLQPMTGRRLFEAAVERRLGPLIHQQYHLHHQSHHQVLKCPRCDSVDTKFCYYNNYNLSQPRHFCKSCRRYWTRGGVLRNVPVGGGCRKNKRSKAKQSPPDTTAAPAEFRTDASSPPLKLPEQKSSSHSSSESSTLTAATTATATATEAASGATPFASFSSGGGLLNIRSREPLVIPTPDPNPAGLYMRTLPRYGVETGALSEVGNLAGLVTASASAEPIPPGLEINDVPLGQQPVHATRQQHQWQNQDWSQTLGNLFNQTVQVDLYRMASGLSSGGFGPSDWGGKSEGGFDLPTTVDQAYWRQDLGQWAEPYQGQHPERSPYLP